MVLPLHVRGGRGGGQKFVREIFARPLEQLYLSHHELAQCRHRVIVTKVVAYVYPRSSKHSGKHYISSFGGKFKEKKTGSSCCTLAATVITCLTKSQSQSHIILLKSHLIAYSILQKFKSHAIQH